MNSNYFLDTHEPYTGGLIAPFLSSIIGFLLIYWLVVLTGFTVIACIAFHFLFKLW